VVDTNRQPELLGQTVVVIGGSSGMGLETGRHARAEGGPGSFSRVAILNALSGPGSRLAHRRPQRSTPLMRTNSDSSSTV
jgi:hypothetical protein